MVKKPLLELFQAWVFIDFAPQSTKQPAIARPRSLLLSAGGSLGWFGLLGSFQGFSKGPTGHWSSVEASWKSQVTSFWKSCRAASSVCLAASSLGN